MVGHLRQDRDTVWTSLRTAAVRFTGINLKMLEAQLIANLSPIYALKGKKKNTKVSQK